MSSTGPVCWQKYTANKDRHIEKQGKEQRNRHTNKFIDRQTDLLADRQADMQTDEHRYTKTDRHTD